MGLPSGLCACNNDYIYQCIAIFKVRIFHLMNILLMAAEIATLGEGSITEIALVGPLRGVLSEVITQVATLAECGVAVGVLAPEVELALLVVGVSDFDNLMPVIWDSFKMLDIDFGIPTFLMVVTRTGA